MMRWFLASPSRSRLRFRPACLELEDRCLLAAPVIDSLGVPLNLPANKSLIVPFTATDPDGGSITWTITSSNPQVQVIPHLNNTYLELTVAGFGELEFQLLNDVAPNTAALIGGMAQSGFYDGLTFHRVVNNFMIQGGDPAGNGSGGPGFNFDDEFNPQAIFSGTGQLAMANSGRDTNGSQFFITEGPQRFLDFNHTIFGQLVRGFDVLDAITSASVVRQDPQNPQSELSKPASPIVISSARIVQNATDAVFTLLANGAGAGATTTLTVTATASTGGSTTQTFQTSVVADVSAQNQPINDPPILGPVSHQVSPTGAPVTIHLTHTDLEGDAVEYGAAVLQPNAANATVTTTRNADGSANVVVTRVGNFTGPVQVIVGVRQQGAVYRGSSDYPWDIQIITVAFGDQPLTLNSIGPINATTGVGGYRILATLTDADPNGVASDYRVSINWGDGSPLDNTGQVVLHAGQFYVVGNHTYQRPGNYPVRIVVTDIHQSTPGGNNGGATAVLQTSVVSNVPPPAPPSPAPVYVAPPVYVPPPVVAPPVVKPGKKKQPPRKVVKKKVVVKKPMLKKMVKKN